MLFHILAFLIQLTAHFQFLIIVELAYITNTMESMFAIIVVHYSVYICAYMLTRSLFFLSDRIHV